ncbi:MAG TPA: polysaccharide biosynthesis/export family protein [Verrucomicrobiae bacterium]|nr:polysaccharide biosynthesis/export family protein [Verrucomicrobiae bacterium]
MNLNNYCTYGLCLGIALLAGCASQPGSTRTLTAFGDSDTRVILTNRVQPEWLRPSTNPFTLGPGDKLDLELIGETNSLTPTVVCPDGKIYFNVLDGADVWGLTLSQAKSLIEQKLAEQIRNGPKVSVSLRAAQSKRIWLLGRLQSPGVYPLNRPTTLLEAIAAAGGTTTFITQRDNASTTMSEELADLKHSFVVRRGTMLPVDFDRLINHGDLSQNIYLEPDDFIYLPPVVAPQVYVIGAVGQPRAVGFTEDLTLAGAIAGAYGTVEDAYVSHVAIVRGSFAQPEIAVVDFAKVRRGKAPDVKLQPGDIVHVPFSPYRYLTKYAETIMNTFAASVAINAGSRFFLEEGETGGVFIPVGSRISIQPPPPPPVGQP